MSKVKVEFDKQQVMDLLENANEESKALLEGLIGKENLVLGVQDRVKILDDAYAELGLTMPASNFFTELREPLASRTSAYYDLSIVARALNGVEWKPNFKQKNTVFIPIFRYKKVANAQGIIFEFVESQELENVNNGVQICFKSKALSDYAGQQFTYMFRLI